MSDVKVAFLTDSCSDIPQELTDKYGIDVIGFHIMLDGKEYLERKDIPTNQFYEMMRQSKSVPTTAATLCSCASTPLVLVHTKTP